MPDTKYKSFVERLLLYEITAEPTELPVPILSYLPTAMPTTVSQIIRSDCNIETYIAISATTSVFTTICVIFAAYYLRKMCKAKYLDSIGSSSSSFSESLSSHVIDVEPESSVDTDELFWFEDVYNVDR